MRCSVKQAMIGHALMQRAERMWDVARGPFIESELPTFHQLLRRKGFLKRSREDLASRNAREVHIANNVGPIPHGKIIHRYATYTGSDPRRVPAVLLTIAFVEISFGAWHITGGIGTLAEALGERCQELGVDIHLNSPSKRSSSRKVLLLEFGSDGVLRRADYIISNADSEITFNRLISQSVKAAKREREKLAKREKSFSGFSLLIGLDNSKVSGQLPKLTHHNDLFPGRLSKRVRSTLLR
jgi:phytoene dehydrogenase-like protein